MEGLKVYQKNILHNLHAWILEKDTVSISIAGFYEYAIEARCGVLANNIGTGSKMGSDKEHDKSHIWDVNI